MPDVVKRVFEISDGLASLAHKKAKSLIAELQGEKVLTPAEGKKAVEALGKAKAKIYDVMSKELKKVVAQVKQEVAKKKSPAKKKTRR